MPFLFVWDSCTLIFIVTFHVYVYYNLNWFISSIFLLSTLVPFLGWFQQI
jgi:hypothetical protein